MFLKISQNSQENICAGVSFLIKLQASACNFIKKETLARVFSCEFCEIFKNTFLYETPPVAASEVHENKPQLRQKTAIVTWCFDWKYCRYYAPSISSFLAQTMHNLYLINDLIRRFWLCHYKNCKNKGDSDNCYQY